MNKPAITTLTGPARPVLARLRHGRPLVLAARILAAFALAEITLHTGAGLPAVAGTMAGIVTWLALTARSDFVPPPGR
jgi:hypothetical protein